MVSHELTRLSFESAPAPPRTSVAPTRASLAPPGEFVAPVRAGRDDAEGEGVLGFGLLGAVAGFVMNNLRVSAYMQALNPKP
jgi:hypothetical protein